MDGEWYCVGASVRGKIVVNGEYRQKAIPAGNACARWSA